MIHTKASLEGMAHTSHITSHRRKFTDLIIFYRILLLAATIAYALSYSADVFLNLHFNPFIIPSAGVAFLLFSVFILSFFVDTINRHFNLLSRVIIVAVHLQLIGLSVVNHFRPELLFALLSSAFIASFIFQKIKTLVLFDLTVCAILSIAIYIDKYITQELEQLNVPFTRPYIDPMFFLLCIAGVMILAALLGTIRVVQFRNFQRQEAPEPVEFNTDDAEITLDLVTGQIAEANETAAFLFEALGKNELVGQPLDTLLKDSFSGNYFAEFRRKLSEESRAIIIASFISQKGKSFTGVLQAKKGSDGQVRIAVSEISIESKADVHQKEHSGKQTFDFDLFLISQSVLPMAFIGPDYKFAEVNEAFCWLSGYSKQELGNMKFTNLILPAEQKKEQSILSILFGGKVPVNRTEKRILKKNNQLVWVHVTSSLARDDHGFPRFVVCMIENVSKQKRFEKELIRDKQNLSAVIENAELFIVNVDRHHTILFINEKLKDILFGLTEIVVENGFNLREIVPSRFVEKYEKIFSRGFNGENFSADESFETSDGKPVDLEVVVKPVNDETDKTISIIISLKDISDRKHHERELLRQKQQAESSTEAKSGFLATMSHEIRTPLNGVIGMGKLLDQTQLNPRQQEYVNSILLSGEALLSVINDILDYSKIESSKMELESKPFAIKRCVEESYHLMSAKAIEKNLSLQYTIQNDVPRFVVGDITRLRQILLNLVSNALKFTTSGKITLHISTVGNRTDGVELLFEVRDTGIGISRDKIGKLFTSFSQVDASTSRTYGGTGLGLAICRNLVSLMGGRIWVESEPGSGSSFFFTIHTTAATADQVPDSKSGANQLVNAKLLIISDDNEQVSIFSNYFRRWGMNVQSTNSPLEAIEKVRLKEKIDLIAVDAQMIGANPTRVAIQLRELAPKEELPIILINANEDDITVEFTDKILSAVIPKNVDRSKLLDILLSVFAMEDHQRTQQQKGLSVASRDFARRNPARILIAEDNAINQKLVQIIFESLGYKPDMVVNGLQVIEKLKANPYDIIFMDVQMPEMDGLETTRFILNKLKLTKRPVIIAMTAFALEGDREKCIEAGMDDYISKPFLTEEIIAKLEKWSNPKQGDEKPDRKEKEGEIKSAAAKTILNPQVLERLREISPESGNEFLREVVNMFLQQAPVIVDEIYHFCLEKKYTEMGDSAHKLKGSAVNIGAVALGEMCRIIEINSREGKGEGCKDMMQEMKTVLDLTALELKKNI